MANSPRTSARYVLTAAESSSRLAVVIAHLPDRVNVVRNAVAQVRVPHVEVLCRRIAG